VRVDGDRSPAGKVIHADEVRLELAYDPDDARVMGLERADEQTGHHH
jgi:hypothetical protein